MGINGYGLTLISGTHGAISGIESVSVGGIELAFDDVNSLESYTTGTATFTSGSAAVVGVGTAWSSDMIGRQIRRDNYATWYTIIAVADTTHLTLSATFGTTTGTAAYTILPSRLVESLPMGVRESPVDVTVTYSKTLYATLKAALEARTSSTWTLTDVEGSTHVGSGYVAAVSSLNLAADGHATFTLRLQPSTRWAFTAGS